MAETSENLTYRGRPLFRQDAELYYGDMRDPYIVMLRVLSSEKRGEWSVATRVSVFLLKTATDNPLERVVNTAEKNGLYDALDVGAVWLERALAAAEE